MTTPTKPLKLPEFVTLLAMMVSILALSIDAMLPALGQISTDLKLQNPNDAQFVVSAMFLGFAIGQILAGPISDSFGRKPSIYVGYVIFIAGCILSIVASSFETMLAGRVMQGFGAAFPRIISLALVRDCYEGRAMAKINSIVMAIFILVPAIGPAIGQGVMLVAGWRAIFTLLLCTAVIAFIWFALRQPETLAPDNRRKFSLLNILGGIREIFANRLVTGYMITSGIVFGAFLGYLNSAQQIFQDSYKAGEMFAIYFGIAALAIGAASIFNSNLVEKLGMRYLSWRALIVITVISALFAPLAIAHDGVPPLLFFMAWLLITFFCVGILFGNLNALAMDPLGHMAGLGAAVIGSTSTFISLLLGGLIGAQFNGTVMPLVTGFVVLATLAMLVMWWTERAGSET